MCFLPFRLLRIAFYCLPAMLAGCGHGQSSPLSASAIEDLSGFEIEPGFKIELIASEPLIKDPTAMEIDETGDMYVVSMPGVPFDKSGIGQVRRLRDTNADGVMDQMVIFADSLTMPTGLLKWKKGLLVTDPPNLLYFEDTNGDGKADIRETMLTGFDSSNIEENVNTPVYGLDNWIYMANAGAARTNIFYPAKPDGVRFPESGRGRMVRFRPEKFQLELCSGNTQFGHAFDSWGNHLLVENTNHIYQEVIDSRYLNRNPDLLVSDATQSLSDHRNSAEVFPITRNPEHMLLTDIGVITSSCSITPYMGGAFPDSWNNNDITLVAEPAHNLLHADRLAADGVTFKASRVKDNSEFLASTDPWFRPVNMYIGPDGALYVVDFYREFVEGPEFMDEEVVKNANFYNGNDKGRIYRITPVDAKPAGWSAALKSTDLSNEALTLKLSDPNIWWRRTAQRLLVDRNARDMIARLDSLARQTRSATGRVHALWTLEGIGSLALPTILQALQDKEPGIRVNAIRLAELHLNDMAQLADTLTGMWQDKDAKVRFQLLCTLGGVHSAKADKIRKDMLFNDINDSWMQIAALSAPPGQQTGMLQTALLRFNPAIPAYATLVERLSNMMAVSQAPQAILQFIRKSTSLVRENASWQSPALVGLAEGIKNRKYNANDFKSAVVELISACLLHPSTEVRKSSRKLLTVLRDSDTALLHSSMRKAIAIVVDPVKPEAERSEAIEFLALEDPSPYDSLLMNLINPREPLSVQLSALSTLGRVPGIGVAQFVLKEWPGFTPELRNAALNTFLADTARIVLLLDAVEAGKIQTADIGWPRSVVLMAGRWPQAEDEKNKKENSLMLRARKVLTKKDNKRKDVIEQYKSALTMTGNRDEGKKVFTQNCGICHQVRGAIGVAFGPDLGTIHSWPAEGILMNILEPSQSITVGYDLWDVRLNNGGTGQGIISSETPTAITLKDVDGKVTIISRKDIQSIKALGISPMPTGLEKQVTVKEMADLLAFLTGLNNVKVKM